MDNPQPSLPGRHQDHPVQPAVLVDRSRIPDLATADVGGIAAGLAAGHFTSVELVEACLDRIEALSVGGPHLNAVRSINPDVYVEARQRDEQRSLSLVAGPLHGVPVLIKDNIDVVGLPTTAGSIALADSYPVGDAPLITRLKEAGAIILGKANLTEFANFMANAMPSGYSSLGGQVLNPYNASETPSGSSSGSAVAVAAGLAPLAVGTETSGSILSPAHANSVVGVKPTVGAVSRTGIVPISATQDTAGPMTKTVHDAAVLLAAMVSIDPQDAATAANPLVGVDLVAGLSVDALQGVRLGYLDNDDALYGDALQVLRDQGAELIKVTVGEPEVDRILGSEFQRDLNAYLARLPENAPMRTLAQIQQYNLDHPQALKFGQAAIDGALEVDLADPAQREAYEKVRDRGVGESRTMIDSVLTEHRLAAVVSRSETIGVGARAGYPSVSVPIGYAAGNHNPMAMTFLGSRWSDPMLLALAHAYEQASQLRRTPEEINPSLFRGATVHDQWDATVLIPPRPDGDHRIA